MRKLSSEEVRNLPLLTSTWKLVVQLPKNFRPEQIAQVRLLDIDKMRKVTMDEDRVEKAVRAFYGNDPYPRPLAEDGRDQRLWVTCRDQFVRASKTVIGDGREEVKALPGLFIERFIEEQRVRVQRRGADTSESVPPLALECWGFPVLKCYSRGLELRRDSLEH